jgi:capsular polysaccharide biosynthesis protein
LLPKALLAERAFPGRFRFAMPQAVLDNADPCAAWSWMRDSLAAGGIAAERLLPLKPDTVYRFHALHAVSPVWAEGVLHPHAAQAVRDAFAAIPPAEARRIAVEPGPDAACVLDLAEPIYTLFAAHGFSRLRPSALPLAEQVAAFKGAVCVFGLDGEDLGNLILAPEGVHLITAGAELAGDPYERALVLDRAGRITRVRGTVAPGAEPAGPARLWLDSQAMAEVVA